MGLYRRCCLYNSHPLEQEGGRPSRVCAFAASGCSTVRIWRLPAARPHLLPGQGQECQWRPPTPSLGCPSWVCVEPLGNPLLLEQGCVGLAPLAPLVVPVCCPVLPLPLPLSLRASRRTTTQVPCWNLRGICQIPRRFQQGVGKCSPYPNPILVYPKTP